MNKEKIIKKLNDLGWEYIVDEFTHSEDGHRREHFQRLKIFDFEDGGKLAELSYALIFHYFDEDEGRENECTIQTSQMCGDYEKIIPYYKKTCYGFYRTIPDVSLSTEEMKLFTELMVLIDSTNKEVKNDL